MVILGDEYTLNKSPRLLFYRKQSETAEKKIGRGENVPISSDNINIFLLIVTSQVLTSTAVPNGHT